MVVSANEPRGSAVVLCSGGGPDGSSSTSAQGTAAPETALFTVPDTVQVASVDAVTREAPKWMAEPAHQKAKNTNANSAANTNAHFGIWLSHNRRSSRLSSSQNSSGINSSSRRDISVQAACFV